MTSRRRSRNALTIYDVAQHAGVSPMTVSRVINGETGVRETTRATVTASIEALNFSPNLAARSLAGADVIRIALLYSNPSAAYLSEFLVGCLEQSSQAGCQLVIEKCDGPQSERAAIRKLVTAGANGVILPPPLCDSQVALAALTAGDTPAIGVATGRPPSGLSVVRIDDFAASRVMTRRLLALGHRDIALIKGHPNQIASLERERGYRTAMDEADIPVSEDRVLAGYFTFKSGFDAAERLLDAPPRPSAIFACNDDMAAGAIAVAHRQGLDVPRDLSVVGFDDTALASTVWPTLTTIRQPIADMARTAVTLLIDQIRARRDGKRLEPVHRLLQFTLVERESTAKYRTSD
jgi:LacI family transcriptional regulator